MKTCDAVMEIAPGKGLVCDLPANHSGHHRCDKGWVTVGVESKKRRSPKSKKVDGLAVPAVKGSPTRPSSDKGSGGSERPPEPESHSEVGKDFGAESGEGLKRYLAMLSCKHQVALEDKPKIGTREFCPECFDYHVIVRAKPFEDEDAA